MPTVPEIFDNMQSRYLSGVINGSRSYYFSVGEHKYTVSLSPESCEVTPGNSGDADCVLKVTPDLFMKMVLEGKRPGTMDVMRGRIKTNSPAMLQDLTRFFRFGA